MAFTSLTRTLKAWFMFLSLQATVSAQTFADYPMSNVWPGISPACLAALNTTVDCLWILAESAENHQPRLNARDLADLCTPSCLPSLNNAKATIQAACTLTTDAITLDTGTYPATYLVDLFIYTYGINCRRDSTTQEYCDVLFAQWLNQPSLSAAQGRDRGCSDCMLSVVQLQLNSPFGYDADFASEFVSLTSSCSKTGYAFTSPPPYTVSATGIATATGTSSSSPSASPTEVLEPGCVSLYTIQAGDTCNSIALAQNVSTFAVYGSHGITDCSNLPAGSKLCLLGQCLLHQVQETDTCDSIIAGAGITVSPSMFVAWNPNIDAVCSNLYTVVGMYICLSRPAGLLTPNITLPDATAPATATAWPTIYPPVETQLPMAPGTLTGCQRYVNYRDVTIQDSFYQPEAVLFTEVVNHCGFVAMNNDILLGDLRSWNPSLSEANCALAAGYSYCVSLSDSTGVPEELSSSRCIDVDPSIILPGTTPSCNCYTQISGFNSGFVTCQEFADEFRTTVATLQAWNPWLGADCDVGLFANLIGDDSRAVCVRVGNRSGPATTTTLATSSGSVTSTQTSSSTAPASSAPGTVCISGSDTGNPNQAGLCSFTCHYGYCPAGPCVCLAYGAQVPEPPVTGVAGYPLAGLDASYIGLCSYVYNHGYYPTGACTSNPDGSPQT